MKRPDWNQYFMDITEKVATRSTCLRRKVGAIVVRRNRILTTGYNGAPSGLDHCLDIGCLRDKMNIPSGERQELCRGIHAEQNALIQASKFGISLEGATIYVTNQPCITCSKLIINSGIEKIIYKNPYPDELALKLLKEARIEVEIYE
ncbi:MAG: deoxycytidylate deaminase [Fusobacteriota bacterium]